MSAFEVTCSGVVCCPTGTKIFSLVSFLCGFRNPLLGVFCVRLNRYSGYFIVYIVLVRWKKVWSSIRIVRSIETALLRERFFLLVSIYARFVLKFGLISNPNVITSSVSSALLASCIRSFAGLLAVGSMNDSSFISGVLFS